MTETPTLVHPSRRTHFFGKITCEHGGCPSEYPWAVHRDSTGRHSSEARALARTVGWTHDPIHDTDFCPDHSPKAAVAAAIVEISRDRDRWQFRAEEADEEIARLRVLARELGAADADIYGSRA
jgi:hypothetical protein